MVVHNAGLSALPHEIGHYLGLEHPSNEESNPNNPYNSNNPMFPVSWATWSVKFTAEQGATMRVWILDA